MRTSAAENLNCTMAGCCTASCARGCPTAPDCGCDSNGQLAEKWHAVEFAQLCPRCAMKSSTSPMPRQCRTFAILHDCPQLEVRRFLQLLVDPDTKPDGELHIVSTANVSTVTLF